MQSTTRKNLIIAACYTGTLVLGMLIGPRFFKENANSKNGTFIPFLPGGRAEKVDKVLNIIEENYVDAVKADSLEDLAISQILKRLDPHSAYLPPAEAKYFSEDLDGNYHGIGVEYLMLNDTLVVTSVLPKGPAAKAGIKSGDKVLKIDQTSIAGTQATSKIIAGLIRGRRGTDVKLYIKRQAQLSYIVISRDKIIVSSIDAAFLLKDKIGYIKISKFGARTDNDFIEALISLQEKGMDKLVLDLRGNGGGYLNAATALADQFLGDKKLIAYTKGEHEPRTDYFATGEGKFEKGKLLVLIDENSASASEIVAGAIQDLDRGMIVGRRSFGKGLVQEQFSFGDGSALNLTVARYFTPSGRSIQKPYQQGAEKYFREVGERLRNGELEGKHLDSLYDKSKTYKTSSGRMIYGGGGIMPDVYVPIDTTGHNEFYYSLIARGILTEFLYNVLVRQEPPHSLSQLADKFTLTDQQYQQIVSIAQSKDMKFGQQQVREARHAIEARLKSQLAAHYFGDEGYYRVLNNDDKVIARSLELLKQP